jgi:hypothetical protein
LLGTGGRRERSATGVPSECAFAAWVSATAPRVVIREAKGNSDQQADSQGKIKNAAALCLILDRWRQSPKFGKDSFGVPVGIGCRNVKMRLNDPRGLVGRGNFFLSRYFAFEPG